ncbi:transcriptional regulator [Nesterenkonia sp. E16_7]|uniref:P-II family nitrogen regulator n=1 Tax=unclassified Nesterenkonia TaxID=2629769 RepID=UPI001A9110FE|nr:MULTISPECIES: transcriptional regulator [unclassified Nesterenkonia]MBO0595354.1 transcriptional regulator [Nesterenkonia sp. E16_10]MBO0599198.1 transcriptional regulator [Nesterenkonia sp. E16_7]
MMSHRVVFVVIPDDQEERAISLVEDAGATGVTALSARGVGAHPHKTFFGVRFTGAQSVLMMVVPEEKVQPITDSLHEVLFKRGESHGICFSVPVDQVSMPGHSEGS